MNNGPTRGAAARIRNFDYASALSAISHLAEFADTDDEFRTPSRFYAFVKLKKNYCFKLSQNKIKVRFIAVYNFSLKLLLRQNSFY